ncbi:MAG: DUF2752 domain-containing protein [Aeromicrobium erythreum]
MAALDPSPSVARSRGELLRAPLLLGAAGLGVVAALHLRDPHQAGSWGGCPFLALTGLPCPGCGGLRAVNDLTNGDVVGAISSNVLAVLLLATSGVLWLVWTWRRARGQDAPLLRMNLTAGLVLLGLFVAFGAFRWTPWGAWLAP